MYVVRTINGKIKYKDPPDGKWGWVVLFASFFIFGICYSTLKTLGFFFNHFKEEFESNNYQTSWISSLGYSMMGIAAPLYAVLDAKIGARKLLILSGFISACGLFVAAFANHIFMLYLGLGIVMALGFCWAHLCAICQVGLYFKKYRSVAIGITAAGSPVIASVMPYLSHLLEVKYGWRGAMMLYSGITLNICALGTLIRPISFEKETGDDDGYEVEKEIESSSTTEIERGGKLWKFITTYWVLSLFIIPELIGDLAYYIPVIYIVPYSLELGMSEGQAAQILSMTAIADIFARPLGGLLLSTFKRVENNIILYMFVTILFYSLIQIIPLYSTSYVSLCVYAMLCGAAFGIMVPGTLNLVPVLLGSENIQAFMSAKFFVNGISTLAGPPIAGYLVDQAGSYRIAYFYCGICLLITSFSFLFIHILVKKRGGVILK